MRKQVILLWLGGICMALSALPHALLGWPSLAAGLVQSQVPPALIAGLAVGWYFGSVGMASMGIIVCLHAWLEGRGRRPHPAALWVIGAGYLAFGLAAFVWRDFNPHFLSFVLLGLLVLVGSRPARVE